ncbi:conserved hypothetical protein [Acidithiobacillus ferrivorans]|uniref:Uncharacterized protein n=2 Tax=root TaxID=1 RepID=A0A060UKG0_9PROT|nr:conserved hypothetical protein [Acidithiobacillus ferrivorans]
MAVCFSWSLGVETHLDGHGLLAVLLQNRKPTPRHRVKAARDTPSSALPLIGVRQNHHNGF